MKKKLSFLLLIAALTVLVSFLMAADKEPTTWIGGDSRFHPTGLSVPPNWGHSAQTVIPQVGNNLPDKFDWREEAPGKTLTPIRNQGNCGSCWAFSTSATVADAIHRKDNKPDLDLSEQWEVSCNKDGYSCGGGWYVFGMHKDDGTVYEPDFPYEASDVPCKQSLPHHEKLESWAFVDGDSGVPSVDKIKAAIYNYGPISVAVAADGGFQSYTSGVFNTCGGSGINHAVNLVGWNDAEGYWIMRNSWGPDWGEKGYMRIKYGCNEIGYAAAFVTYGSDCTPQPYANAGKGRTIRLGEKTKLGTVAKPDTTYSWEPTTGLDNPTAAQPIVKPTETTIYKTTATTKCGKATHSVRIGVFK